jgi:NAD(P)-dependent dehydrogenase (short-subunit alcohol dehydrogenase family)
MASQFPFKDKVITVTGASRGTGLALVRYLLERGATISGCATSDKNLADAMAGIERDLPDAVSRVMFRVVDIADPATVKAWIEETVALHGKLDGCANVAAREQRVIYPITDLDAGYFNELITTNVSGLFNCLKEEMKHVKDGGSIVNCGSITSKV